MKLNKHRLVSVLLLAIPTFTLSAQATQVVTSQTQQHPLGFTLSDKLPSPKGKETGRGQPIEDLVVKYAADYENDPYLKEQVVQFRRWEWQDLYRTLDEKAHTRPNYLNTYRIQAEAYLINKDYKEALSQLDQILRQNPQDLQALAVSVLAARVLEDDTQIQARLVALQKRAPQAAQAVGSFLKFTDDVLAHPFSGEPSQNLDFDAIAVFGQSPNADGTPSKGLLARLEKTKEMAEKYPKAKLILSGGPVKTKFAESDVMAKWLIKQGINQDRLLLDPVARDTPGNAIGMVELFKQHNLHRILGVGTLQHIPRATAVLKGYADYVGYPIEIDGVGGGNPPSPAAKQIEALYTYVNVARSMGLFTLGDFKRFE